MFKIFGSRDLASNCPIRLGLGGDHGLGFRAMVRNLHRPQAYYRDRHLYQPPQQLEVSIWLGTQTIQPVLIQSWSIQKAGNQLTECEDAWAYGDRLGGIAIADGATESSFAKEWAQLLVSRFVQDLPNGEQVTAWIQALQVDWLRWLSHQELAWFAKRKAAAGAFATFLGLRFSQQEDQAIGWRAIAVGDACLFVVRDRQLNLAFPKTSSLGFNNTPALLGTHRNTNPDYFLKVQGKAQVGDRFYLATDAISCWIWRQIEDQQDPWVHLEQLNSQIQFADWITDLRDRGAIVNDDTTLLCIEMQGASVAGK
ncbi:MAG: protein phosphatase 2C domain-containing protein [Pseudanabaenaceae cyanobacterium bins.39]|nr:protein phosphatase 2C domain-containing protein [Pseudanabaenaceae cyanobacterium bins.39]